MVGVHAFKQLAHLIYSVMPKGVEHTDPDHAARRRVTPLIYSVMPKGVEHLDTPIEDARVDPL